MSKHFTPPRKDPSIFVTDEIMGEVWPGATPAEDPVVYGHVSMTPEGAFEARSYQSFTLSYTVGRYGLDDTGSLKIVFRYMGDFGDLQTSDATAPGYVSAAASNGTPLTVEYNPYGHNRPRFRALTIRVFGGCLAEGNIITVAIGDTSKGSPGMALQTFCESSFEFKVLVDPCAVGHYVPVPDSPVVSVVPGPPAVWRAVLPTLRRPGESFRFGIKAEDKWGNPSDLAEAELCIRTSIPVIGLPKKFSFTKGTRTQVFEGLTCAKKGTLKIEVYNTAGHLLVASNPLLIRDGNVGGYWGDMHGQSGESVGINTCRQYFEFARNHAVLDATSHQANDFHINKAFWAHINELTAEYNEDGTFVTFPGYEWSGNTAVGGDRNVYFRTEGRQIHRSSHALIPDRSDIATDSPNANQLFNDLQDEDCVVYAHVGGRYADISYAHDPRLETAMEIHSAWGTFEWLLTDGFKLGHRCGVVCNSDGHKGRPGASYPGAAKFGAYGGLTCFLAKGLTRDDLFECLRRRHHYGTTGARVHLDVHAHFDKPSTLFLRDPNAFPDTKKETVGTAMMGDIIRTDCDEITLDVSIAAARAIERLEIRNGEKVIATHRPYDASHLGRRIRILWSGAEYRGRGRQSTWRGRAKVTKATVVRIEKINAWNHERTLEQADTHTVIWDTITTGNYGGVDIWYDTDDEAQARISIDTNHGNLDLALSDIGVGDHVIGSGGLDRKLKAFRMPEACPAEPMAVSEVIPLSSPGDNQIWVSAYTEDGFQVWSSPIFIFRK